MGRTERQTSQDEKDKRTELVPKDRVLGQLMISMPAKDKVWLIEEAYRRNIPISWVATEVIKLGIEVYGLIGIPKGEDNGTGG